MRTQGNEAACVPIVNFNIRSLEQRKSIFEFLIRQLEIIEEQTYLLEQEPVGRTIFQAIQLLENISRPFEEEASEENPEENDE